MVSVKQIVVIMRYLGLRALRQKANALLAMCILVCSTIAAALGFFSNSVQTALDSDIANYLGAPMVLRSDAPVLIEADPILAVQGLDQPVFTVSYTIGALSANGYQSVSLKAVSSGYPLQGDLIVQNGSVESQVSALQLSDGEVWMDQRALDELQLAIGGLVQIGRAQLKVAGVIVHEPDKLTQLQHALPRAMVNHTTLANTGVAIGNSRGEHRVLLSGSEASLKQIETAVQARSKSVEVLKPGKGRHPFSRISLRAERLLNVILVLILLMCGGAAASLASHTVQNYAMPATVLRCMGVKRKAVAWALCLQLIGLSIVVGLVGCLLAWLLQPVLNQVMEPHMRLSVAPVSIADLIAPVGIGVVTVIAFVVPKLQQLGSISVSCVLRGQMQLPKRGLVVISLAVMAVFGLLWINSDNMQLTIMLVGGVAAVTLLSIGFGWILSQISSQCYRFFQGPIKVAVRSIGRSSRRHITSLVCVAIAMMAVLMTVTLRGSFLDLLQMQMLETDGNYIFTGLPAEQQSGFAQVVEDMGAQVKSMHPTVSARLISINGVEIDKALNKESETREETRSRVRLSWANSLPDNNRLLEGSWPSIGSNEVSVESEVMTDLGLSLGDALGFRVGEQIYTAEITSRREYKGGGSRMMFWFMFGQDALNGFEQHRMGGVLINDQAPLILSQLAKEFSQVRITNLERQLSGIRDIMIVITRLMNTTLLLLFCGALVVIVATSFVSSVNRDKQSQLMRALGLRRSQVYAMNIVEQAVIGLVACAVGVMGVQLISGALFQNLFALPYQLDWVRAISLTSIICLTFVLIGTWFAFQQLRKPVRLS